MTEDVYQRLLPCVKDKRPDDALFTWGDGSPVRDFRVAWSKMCKAAKVPILLHDFRRSAIRNMIRAGVPEKTSDANLWTRDTRRIRPLRHWQRC